MDLAEEWNLKELKENEEKNHHKPVEEEYSLYQAIKAGDVNYVRADCQKGGFGNPDGMGVLSKNSLTNIKYHFAIAAAMIARHCIEGGMDMEQAFRLSDFYIMKMDSFISVQEVIALHTAMCLDFTEKMLLLKKDKIISKSVQLCIQYIYTHINENLSLESLADYVNLSSSYLSRLFNQEMGVSISTYIRGQKIEKAKNLLKYSGYSYIEIANYLGFSSQSHFIHTFHKYTGMTPKKFRDKYFHTTW